MQTILLEFFKLRRKHLFLMVIIFLTVEIAWSLMSVSVSMSRNQDSDGWKSVIMTTASLNGLFLPILSAVVVSRICDMEHKGNTWKLILSTSIKRSHIYAAKYACACIVMLFAVALQVLAITTYGMTNNFEGSIPFSLLLQFSGGTILTNMAVIALQQWISLSVKNQAFGLSLGMLGGFAGMTADLFPATISRFFVWSYYTGLSPVFFNYMDDSMEFVTRNIGFILPAAVFFACAMIYSAGSFHVSRQKV